jgi:hypothetical protein
MDGMRRCRALWSVLVGLLAATACLADNGERTATQAGGWSVKTADGLEVVFAKDATIRHVMLEGRELPLRGKGGFYVTEVLPPDGKRKSYGLVTGQIRDVKSGMEIHDGAGDGLELQAIVSYGGDQLFVSSTIRDTTGKDRALIVEFVLPVDCTGWMYENTPLQKQVIGKDTRYPSLQQPDSMLFSDTSPPDERDLVRLDMGRLPYNAVHNGEVGLSFGVPMSHPRIFLMSVDPRGLVMRFNVGVSPVTEKMPSQASCHFCVIRSDPAWGIRSAAERFYRFYPELFETKAKSYGNFRDMNSITTKLADKKDFAVSYGEGDFQWTDGQFRAAVVPVVEELGLTVFHWREPWSWFDQVPKDMTVKDEKANLQEEAKHPKEGKSHGQYCGAPLGLCAEAALNSVMENENGEMSRVRYEYGCWMLAVNLDPELPHPNRADLATDWQYRWLKQWDDPKYKGPRNYAWDSSTGWTGQHLLNYRREHFKTVDNPLTFDGRTGRLCQLKALHDWEFAKYHAEMIRNKGGLTCANTSPMAALLYGQYMDVLVREEPVSNIHDDAGIVLRMLAYRKPVAYYQPPENAKDVRLGMFYGFAPGFDATKEEMRAPAKQYMPIIETIDRAGWEPVTRARGEGLAIERYGRKAGEMYFTVRRDGKPAGQKDAKVVIDAKALGFDPAAASIEEIAEKREVQRQAEKDSLGLQFPIAVDETLVLSVKKGK